MSNEVFTHLEFSLYAKFRRHVTPQVHRRMREVYEDARILNLIIGCPLLPANVQHCSCKHLVGASPLMALSDLVFSRDLDRRAQQLGPGAGPGLAPQPGEAEVPRNRHRGPQAVQPHQGVHRDGPPAQPDVGQDHQPVRRHQRRQDHGAPRPRAARLPAGLCPRRRNTPLAERKVVHQLCRHGESHGPGAKGMPLLNSCFTLFCLLAAFHVARVESRAV